MSVNISGQSYWSNGAYAGNYSALYWNGNTLNTSNAMTTTDYQAYSARYAVTSQLAVNALYAKNKTKDNSGVQSSKNDVTQAGVSYTMGKNVLVAKYGTVIS